MSKPREWWIWPSLEFGLPAWHCDKTAPLNRDDKDIHVVEYSAYQALAQAAKDFMSALTDEEKVAATDKLSTLISEVDL